MMALTPYTTPTNIIGSLGTTPEDRPGMTDQELKDTFDENSVNLAAALNLLITELTSSAPGKGASQIGVQDSAGRFTAADVEAVLAEIAGSGRTTETLKGLADIIGTHTAKTIANTTALTRDVSVTGTQTITLPFKAKNIHINAFVAGTQKSSWGFCGESASNQNCMYMLPSAFVTGDSGYIVRIYTDASNYATGTITAISDTGITITWTKTGSPTGTAILCVNTITH